MILEYCRFRSSRSLSAARLPSVAGPLATVIVTVIVTVMANGTLPLHAADKLLKNPLAPAAAAKAPAAAPAAAPKAPPAAPKTPAAAPKAPATEPAATEPPAGEEAIRASAEAFVKAFNAGDAAALGALWIEDAAYTDLDGNLLRGRDAIVADYEQLFTEQPGSQAVVDVESIRLLGPDVAVEKGVVHVKAADAEAPTASRYTVVHVLRDGDWRMAVGHDTPYVEVANGEYLKDLTWLIGDWMPAASEEPLRIRFEWMAQKNFIKKTFTVVKDGNEKLTGGQIIGWNPRLGKIVSWDFDAQGGIGDGVWTQDGDQWVIEANGTFKDGTASSSVNLLTPVDANRFTWQSVNRKLEGVSLPDSQPITIVRAPKAK